jgi:hypothetical protein
MLDDVAVAFADIRKSGSNQTRRDQLVHSDGPDGSKVYKLKRTFLKPDGSTLYEELSTVTLWDAPKNGFKITITTAKGSAHGSGYCFDRQCHYDMDISPGVHIGLTYTMSAGRIDAIASSTNKGNFTSWTESLTSLA